MWKVAGEPRECFHAHRTGVVVLQEQQGLFCSNAWHHCRGENKCVNMGSDHSESHLCAEDKSFRSLPVFSLGPDQFFQWWEVFPLDSAQTCLTAVAHLSLACGQDIVLYDEWLLPVTNRCLSAQGWTSQFSLSGRSYHYMLSSEGNILQNNYSLKILKTYFAFLLLCYASYGFLSPLTFSTSFFI